MDFFTAQNINSNGKAWVVFFNEIPIYITPIAPLVLPEKEPKEIDLSLAMKFITDKSLTITSQVLSFEKNLIGITVSSFEIEGFIPIIPDKRLPDIPETYYNPYWKKETSDIENFRKEKKNADVIKNFALYFFAKSETDNPEIALKEVEKKLKIIPNHDYSNKNFFSEECLILPNNETKDRLLKWVKAQYYSNPNYIKNLISPMDGYYQSAEDFIKRPNQLIFTSLETVEFYYEHKKEKIAKKIYDSLKILYSSIKEPFVYRNFKINGGNPVLIQKVKDDSLERASSVSWVWIEKRINLGWDASIIPVGRISIYSPILGMITKPFFGKTARVLEFEKNKFTAMFMF